MPAPFAVQAAAVFANSVPATAPPNPAPMAPPTVGPGASVFEVRFCPMDAYELRALAIMSFALLAGFSTL
jgi:hypothetical protein